MYRRNVKSASATPNNEPPMIPMELAQIVRQGNMMIMAKNLGVTRKRTGLMAMVSKASISSVTFMLPISAAKAEPERPITTMAVTRGPRFRELEKVQRGVDDD